MRPAVAWPAILSWTGVLGMALIGIVWGLITFVITAVLYYGSDSDVGWFVFFTFLALVPAGFACWAHDRHMYGLAGGMAAFWLGMVVYWQYPWADGPAMSDEAIDGETRRRSRLLLGRLRPHLLDVALVRRLVRV